VRRLLVPSLPPQRLPATGEHRPQFAQAWHWAIHVLTSVTIKVNQLTYRLPLLCGLRAQQHEHGDHKRRQQHDDGEDRAQVHASQPRGASLDVETGISISRVRGQCEEVLELENKRRAHARDTRGRGAVARDASASG
jgi:hypothetical protein